MGADRPPMTSLYSVNNKKPKWRTTCVQNIPASVKYRKLLPQIVSCCRSSCFLLICIILHMFAYFCMFLIVLGSICISIKRKKMEKETMTFLVNVIWKWKYYTT